MSTILELEDIRKSFGEKEILRGISLKAKQGEFITLLGASGCGKTTILRIIAGLENCDSGRVVLEGRDVTQEVPEKRDVNTVFQSYALFPHMTVGENVGYGLKIRRKSKAEISEAVADALSLVQLSGYENRKTTELSGGQRQRVAIARALINRPKVLLLDEPLGALDLQLRRQMQVELKRLQKQLGITFIYITHDQEEALNMSDRIAVMKNGVFQQLDTPSMIYDRPRNAYVAYFVGSANILKGKACYRQDGLWISYAGGYAPVACYGKLPEEGESLTAAVRSEYLDFGPLDGEGIPGIIKEKSFSAGMLRITVEAENGEELVASRHGIDYALSPGEKVQICFKREQAVAVEENDAT